VNLTANPHDDNGFEQTSVLGGNRDATSVTRLHLAAQHDLSDGSTLELRSSYVRAQIDAGDVGPPNPANTNPANTITNSLNNLRWTKSLSATHEIQMDLSYANDQAVQAWRGCWPVAVFYPEAAQLYQSNPAAVNWLADQLVGINTQAPRPPVSAYDWSLALKLLSHFSGDTFSQLQQAATPDCGYTNQNTQASRTQLEFQDTYVVSDALRFVGGLGYRVQHAASQTFLNGDYSNEVKWVFGNMEYRPVDWLSANLGGYGEHNSLSGGTFSPRLGLNARLDDNQSVRAVFSKGTRSPDLFEERANWSYTFTNLSNPVMGSTTAKLALQAASPGGLQSEEIWSRELGYLLTLRSMGLSFDAKVFDDQLKNLISERLSLLDFSPDNQGRVRLTGAEVEAHWDLDKRWSGWLSYSHLLNRDASDPQEQTQYARDSGAIGVSLRLRDDWRVSLAHYAASGNGLVELGYARTDLTLSHYLLLGQAQTTLSLTMGYLQTPATVTYADSTHSFESAYDGRFSFFGQARVAF
jgi:iron complex outermembrane receptor protein